MGIKPLNILLKQAGRPSLKGCKTVLEKAAKLGLAPESATEINPLISNASKGEWLRQGQKILPENLGVYLSDGTLRFQSEEKAIEFGKRKIVKALNSVNPHEVDVSIGESGRILGIVKGDASSVADLYSIDKSLADKVKISMHGHPNVNRNSFGQGFTTAISTNDYLYGFKDEPSINKMIVFNSKGEQYSIQKIQGFKYDDVHSDLFDKDFMKIILKDRMQDPVMNGKYSRRIIFDEAYRLEEEYFKLCEEYDKMLTQKTLLSGGIQKLNEKAAKILNESCKRLNMSPYTAINGNKFFEFLENRVMELKDAATNIVVEDSLKFDKAITRNTHEFWKVFGNKYGVKMETNFSHFT